MPIPPDSYSYFCLCAYILLWLITLIVYYRKHKSVDAGLFSIFLCLVYAISSLVLYKSGDFEFKRLMLLPFIFLYLMLIVTSLPFYKYRSSRVRAIGVPNMLLFNGIAIFCILCSLIQLPQIVANFGESVSRMVLDISAGQDLYRDASLVTESTGSGISNIFAILSSAFSCLGTFFLFYSLALPKRNFLILTGLIISQLLSIFNSVIMGARGGLVQDLLMIAISYLLMKDYYAKKIRKVILSICVTFCLLVVFAITVLTISRFGDTGEGLLSWVNYYIGQANLYFNNYAFDNNGIRYGDRVIPLFKRMLSISDVPVNYLARREKYANLYINDEVFCTYIGDFVFDFGPILGALILVVFSLWALSKTAIHHHVIHFHQLILLHFVACNCIMGGMTLFAFADTSGNLKIIVYLIAYLMFKILDKRDHTMPVMCCVKNASE